MSLTLGGAAQRNQYARDAVLSASPARLLTMLYDRLLLDLSRAEQAQQASDWNLASENLKHAQAIITELSTSLNTDAWDGAEGVLALYNYLGSTLITANIHHDATRTREAIDLLEPLRLAWHEAASALPAQSAGARTGGGELGVA